MADDPPNLPWETLASHFTYIHANPAADNVTDLFPLSKPTQAEDIRAFINAFTTAIPEHAARERAKHPAEYPPPAEGEVVIDDETVALISPLFRKIHDNVTVSTTHRWDAGVVSNPSCRHPAEPECNCLIPYSERRAEALLRLRQRNECYDFMEVNGAGSRSWELVRTLLLHGAMEPVLRLCAHPWNDFSEWWNMSMCCCGSGVNDSSSNKLYEKAMLSYLALGLLRRFPSTWDPQRGGKTPQSDYRLTRMYQRAIRDTTKGGETSRLPVLPHRRFFGIDDDQFRMIPQAREAERWAHLETDFNGVDRSYPEGLVAYDEFLAFEQDAGYQPHADDIEPVRGVLGERGLPAELADEIMRLGGYVPKRRLKIPHDPFRPRNRAELDMYLAECWAVLVRCEVFAKAFDWDIEWETAVEGCFWWLLRLNG